MDNEFADLSRYVLEQEFAVAADKFESHRTALITVIGDATLDGFERALESLNYNSKRFRTLANPSVGRWLTRVGRRLPELVEGLILFSEQTDGALVTFEEEIQRFWEAGITPLVAWPGKIRFANQIRQLLVPYRKRWSLVRLRKTLGVPVEEGADKFVQRAVSTMEAILLPGIYPGLVCLDTSDMGTVYLDTHLSVVAINADHIEELIPMLETELDRKVKPNRALAALYGPKSLQLSEFSAVMNCVRRYVDPEKAACVGGAISDLKRSDYMLYMVTNE